jgi:asparagine synthase (glutamine-hydrolysing)
MTAAMAHRGPDAEGIESWSDAVLGHRRLCIFDLTDAGRQPMLSPDGRVGVVFNGAIYNFPELKRDLESAGYAFRSRTDTEVLIHGYVEWGLEELLRRMRGMFAIALWDDRERKLFLVRDRHGVKPLYFAVRNGCLAFASTARALHRAGFAPEIDPDAMAEYLEYGYVSDSRCIYHGVSKLPAAAVLEWHQGEVGVREYWRPSFEPDFSGTFEEAVEETSRLFLQAVRRRLLADVPVAALLSGGVDSSLVCWALRELGADVSALTAGVPGDKMDESEDARRTARELGIRHKVLDFSRHELPDAGEMAAAFGEPFACSSALGLLRLSRTVKSEATVLLVGEGGDDFFLGYPEHRRYLLSERVARVLPDSAAAVWETVGRHVPKAGPLRRARHFLDFASGGLGAVTHTRDGFPWAVDSGIGGERLAGARVAARAIPRSAASARRLLTEFLEFDRRGRFFGEYMTKVDGATMYYALEARSPFLDTDLTDFAMSLPYEIRLRGGKLKAVLREIARRKIGSRVANGRKRGFGIPAERWMLGRWRAKVEETFRNPALAREAWIDADHLWRAWKRAVAQGTVPQPLWYLYVLELWFRAEIAERPSEDRTCPPLLRQQ